MHIGWRACNDFENLGGRGLPFERRIRVCARLVARSFRALLRAYVLVITSYSIHYTKLYDEGDRDREDLVVVLDPEPPRVGGLPARGEDRERTVQVDAARGRAQREPREQEDGSYNFV